MNEIVKKCLIKIANPNVPMMIFVFYYDLARAKSKYSFRSPPPLNHIFVIAVISAGDAIDTALVLGVQY